MSFMAVNTRQSCLLEEETWNNKDVVFPTTQARKEEQQCDNCLQLERDNWIFGDK